MDKINNLIKEIYSDTTQQAILTDKITTLLEAQKIKKTGTVHFTEKDIVLISYADSIKGENETPLQTMHTFAKKHLKDIFSAIHFLPFYPYSSDDGFSVIDYYAVNNAVGSWENIKELSNDFELMFDFVLNHISAKSQWFQKYLDNDEEFKNLAINVDPSTDLSMVTRPRALPLLTKFNKTNGKEVNLWTTFSDDQIDINFKAPDILFKMIEVLMFYVNSGAKLVRMDAIAYGWKEIGSTCIHLPQIHAIVKLFRAVLDKIAPETILITETNVPHKENISYFGNGNDEAQMVYNFTLPPLLFYTFITGNSNVLSNWAKTLTTSSKETTFFNFTASHDGIGVRPLEGILPKDDIQLLADVVLQNNGKVSYKNNSDGSKSPYELNITYVDALKKENDTDQMHAKRFIASQAIAMSLPGVMATYIHSLLGSHNYIEGLKQTGRNRTINREKLNITKINQALEDASSFRSLIFTNYIKLLKIRREQKAFSPTSSFEILDISSDLFCIKRTSKTQTIYAITNISDKDITFDLGINTTLKDIISKQEIAGSAINLSPYEILWLET